MTYFEHYVLAGGWTMALLLPLSLISTALIVRAILSRRSADPGNAVAANPLLPLAIIAVLVGVIGSISMLMSASLEVSRTGETRNLAAAVERALIPPLWGAIIGCVSYIGFVLLRKPDNTQEKVN